MKSLLQVKKADISAFAVHDDCEILCGGFWTRNAFYEATFGGGRSFKGTLAANAC